MRYIDLFRPWQAFAAVSMLSLGLSFSAMSEESDNKQFDGKKDKKLVLAPMVMSNPAFGDGGGVAAIYFLGEPNERNRSRIISQALISNKDSYFAMGGAILHLNNDEQRAKIFGAHARIRNGFDDFKGGVARFDTEIYFARAEYLTKVAENFYLGPSLSIKSASYEARNDEAPDYFERLNIEDNDTLLLTGMGVYDTRDNDAFPYTGIYGTAELTLAEQDLGSDESYQKLALGFNHYHQLANNDVIAVRHAAQLTNSAPYDAQANLGQRNDIRGFTSGEHVAEHMLSTQVEYRYLTAGKWSLVGFVGAAGLYNGDITDVGDIDWFYSSGFGVRYRLQDIQRVNFRFDVAFGNDNNDGFYVSLREAF